MLGVEAAIIESMRTICWFSTFSTPPPSLQKFVDKSCCYPNIYLALGGGGRGIMAIKQHNSRGSNVDLSGYGCQFVSPQLATLTIITFLLYPPPARDLQHPSPPPLVTPYPLLCSPNLRRPGNEITKGNLCRIVALKTTVTMIGTFPFSFDQCLSRESALGKDPCP